MAAVVLIPFRGGCQYREDAFAWVRCRYERAGLRVIRCPSITGPWCKALAVNPVLEECPEGPVVIADADVWTEGLSTAIEDVEAGAPWAIPHAGVFRLSRQATDAVLVGGREPSEDMDLARPAYRGIEGGGMVVAQRDVLREAPLDRRFVGWGQEDDSWGIALRCLFGPPVRGRRPPLFHLFHPPQERLSLRWGSVESKRLHARYVAAREDPARMRELIEEGR